VKCGVISAPEKITYLNEVLQRDVYTMYTSCSHAFLSLVGTLARKILHLNMKKDISSSGICMEFQHFLSIVLRSYKKDQFPFEECQIICDEAHKFIEKGDIASKRMMYYEFLYGISESQSGSMLNRLGSERKCNLSLFTATPINTNEDRSVHFEGGCKVHEFYERPPMMFPTNESEMKLSAVYIMTESYTNSLVHARKGYEKGSKVNVQTKMRDMYDQIMTMGNIVSITFKSYFFEIRVENALATTYEGIIITQVHNSRVIDNSGRRIVFAYRENGWKICEMTGEETNETLTDGKMKIHDSFIDESTFQSIVLPIINRSSYNDKVIGSLHSQLHTTDLLGSELFDVLHENRPYDDDINRIILNHIPKFLLSVKRKINNKGERILSVANYLLGHQNSTNSRLHNMHMSWNTGTNKYSCIYTSETSTNTLVYIHDNEYLNHILRTKKHRHLRFKDELYETGIFTVYYSNIQVEVQPHDIVGIVGALNSKSKINLQHDGSIITNKALQIIIKEELDLLPKTILTKELLQRYTKINDVHLLVTSVYVGKESCPIVDKEVEVTVKQTGKTQKVYLSQMKPEKGKVRVKIDKKLYEINDEYVTTIPLENLFEIEEEVAESDLQVKYEHSTVENIVNVVNSNVVTNVKYSTDNIVFEDRTTKSIRTILVGHMDLDIETAEELNLVNRILLPVYSITRNDKVYTCTKSKKELATILVTDKSYILGILQSSDSIAIKFCENGIFEDYTTMDIDNMPVKKINGYEGHLIRVPKLVETDTLSLEIYYEKKGDDNKFPISKPLIDGEEINEGNDSDWGEKLITMITYDQKLDKIYPKLGQLRVGCALKMNKKSYIVRRYIPMRSVKYDGPYMMELCPLAEDYDVTSSIKNNLQEIKRQNQAGHDIKTMFFDDIIGSHIVPMTKSKEKLDEGEARSIHEKLLDGIDKNEVFKPGFYGVLDYPNEDILKKHKKTATVLPNPKLQHHLKSAANKEEFNIRKGLFAMKAKSMKSDIDTHMITKLHLARQCVFFEAYMHLKYKYYYVQPQVREDDLYRHLHRTKHRASERWVQRMTDIQMHENNKETLAVNMQCRELVLEKMRGPVRKINLIHMVSHVDSSVHKCRPYGMRRVEKCFRVKMKKISIEKFNKLKGMIDDPSKYNILHLISEVDIYDDKNNAISTEDIFEDLKKRAENHEVITDDDHDKIASQYITENCYKWGNSMAAKVEQYIFNRSVTCEQYFEQLIKQTEKILMPDWTISDCTEGIHMLRTTCQKIIDKTEDENIVSEQDLIDYLKFVHAMDEVYTSSSRLVDILHGMEIGASSVGKNRQQYHDKLSYYCNVLMTCPFDLTSEQGLDDLIGFNTILYELDDMIHRGHGNILNIIDNYGITGEIITTIKSQLQNVDGEKNYNNKWTHDLKLPTVSKDMDYYMIYEHKFVWHNKSELMENIINRKKLFRKCSTQIMNIRGLEWMQHLSSPQLNQLCKETLDSVECVAFNDSLIIQIVTELIDDPYFLTKDKEFRVIRQKNRSKQSVIFSNDESSSDDLEAMQADITKYDMDEKEVSVGETYKVKEVLPCSQVEVVNVRDEKTYIMTNNVKTSDYVQQKLFKMKQNELKSQMNNIYKIITKNIPEHMFNNDSKHDKILNAYIEENSQYYTPSFLETKIHTTWNEIPAVRSIEHFEIVAELESNDYTIVPGNDQEDGLRNNVSEDTMNYDFITKQNEVYVQNEICYIKNSRDDVLYTLKRIMTDVVNMVTSKEAFKITRLLPEKDSDHVLSGDRILANIIQKAHDMHDRAEDHEDHEDEPKKGLYTKYDLKFIADRTEFDRLGGNIQDYTILPLLFTFPLTNIQKEKRRLDRKISQDDANWNAIVHGDRMNANNQYYDARRLLAQSYDSKIRYKLKSQLKVIDSTDDDYNGEADDDEEVETDIETESDDADYQEEAGPEEAGPEDGSEEKLENAANVIKSLFNFMPPHELRDIYKTVTFTPNYVLKKGTTVTIINDNQMSVDDIVYNFVNLNTNKDIRQRSYTVENINNRSKQEGTAILTGREGDTNESITCINPAKENVVLQCLYSAMVLLMKAPKLYNAFQLCKYQLSCIDQGKIVMLVDRDEGLPYLDMHIHCMNKLESDERVNMLCCGVYAKKWFQGNNFQKSVWNRCWVPYCTEKCETYKDTCKKHRCNEGLLQSKVQDEHRRMIQEEKRDFLKRTLMVLEARQYGTGTDLQGVRAIQLHSIPGTFQEFIQQSGRGACMCSSHFRCNDNIKFYDWERMLEVHIALNVRLEDICYHCKITKGNKCRRAASYATQCAPQNPLCTKTESAANACKTDSCMCFVHIINLTEQFTIGSGSNKQIKNLVADTKEYNALENLYQQQLVYEAEKNNLKSYSIRSENSSGSTIQEIATTIPINEYQYTTHIMKDTSVTRDPHAFFKSIHQYRTDRFALYIIIVTICQIVAADSSDQEQDMRIAVDHILYPLLKDLAKENITELPDTESRETNLPPNAPPSVKESLVRLCDTLDRETLPVGKRVGTIKDQITGKVIDGGLNLIWRRVKEGEYETDEDMNEPDGDTDDVNVSIRDVRTMHKGTQPTFDTTDITNAPISNITMRNGKFTLEEKEYNVRDSGNKLLISNDELPKKGENIFIDVPIYFHVFTQIEINHEMWRIMETEKDDNIRVRRKKVSRVVSRDTGKLHDLVWEWKMYTVTDIKDDEILLTLTRSTNERNTQVAHVDTNDIKAYKSIVRQYFNQFEPAGFGMSQKSKLPKKEQSTLREVKIVPNMYSIFMFSRIVPGMINHAGTSTIHSLSKYVTNQSMRSDKITPLGIDILDTQKGQHVKNVKKDKLLKFIQKWKDTIHTIFQAARIEYTHVSKGITHVDIDMGKFNERLRAALPEDEISKKHFAKTFGLHYYDGNYELDTTLSPENNIKRHQLKSYMKRFCVTREGKDIKDCIENERVADIGTSHMHERQQQQPQRKQTQKRMKTIEGLSDEIVIFLYLVYKVKKNETLKNNIYIFGNRYSYIQQTVRKNNDDRNNYLGTSSDFFKNIKKEDIIAAMLAFCKVNKIPSLCVTHIDRTSIESTKEILNEYKRNNDPVIKYWYNGAIKQKELDAFHTGKEYKNILQRPNLSFGNTERVQLPLPAHIEEMTRSVNAYSKFVGDVVTAYGQDGKIMIKTCIVNFIRNHGKLLETEDETDGELLLKNVHAHQYLHGLNLFVLGEKADILKPEPLYVYWYQQRNDEVNEIERNMGRIQSDNQIQSQFDVSEPSYLNHVHANWTGTSGHNSPASSSSSGGAVEEINWRDARTVPPHSPISISSASSGRDSPTSVPHIGGALPADDTLPAASVTPSSGRVPHTGGALPADDTLPAASVTPSSGRVPHTGGAPPADDTLPAASVTPSSGRVPPSGGAPPADDTGGALPKPPDAPSSDRVVIDLTDE